MKRWDEFDVYLFDIDGTLINCRDAVHYFAFCEALSGVAGHSLNLDGVTTHGNTDVGILRDAFALGEVQESQWRPKLAALREGMGDFVDQHAEEFQIEPTPHVEAALQHLLSRQALLGVATGNLRRIGEAKLARAGLLPYFEFAGYSDAFESRREVFAAALEQARGIAGAGASVCVVGDTPLDVQAARACELPVIAVATGIFSWDDLRQEQPEWCVHSFAELLNESDN